MWVVPNIVLLPNDYFHFIGNVKKYVDNKYKVFPKQRNKTHVSHEPKLSISDFCLAKCHYIQYFLKLFITVTPIITISTFFRLELTFSYIQQIVFVPIQIFRNK